MTEKISDEQLEYLKSTKANINYGILDGKELTIPVSEMATELLELRKEQTDSLNYNNDAVIPAIIENLKAVGINPERGLSWMVEEIIHQNASLKADLQVAESVNKNAITAMELNAKACIERDTKIRDIVDIIHFAEEHGKTLKNHLEWLSITAKFRREVVQRDPTIRRGTIGEVANNDFWKPYHEGDTAPEAPEVK